MDSKEGTPEPYTSAMPQGQAHQPSEPFAQGLADESVSMTTKVLEVLEASLSEAIDGLVILDRELSFEGTGRVDFAGIDGEGRLVLVVLLDDDPNTASLEAMDLAVICKRHSSLIAKHLGVPELGLAPCCALVTEHLDQRLMQRLELVSASFEFFELQSLVSERGSRTYLVPAAIAPGVLADTETRDATEISAEDFLQDLTSDSQEYLGILVSRMQRMDSEFDMIFTRDAGHWGFNGREFLRIERSGERVLGCVLPSGKPAMLDDEGSVEQLVEEAFSAYVRLLGLFDEDIVEIEDAFEDPGISSEPLLSPEEIAAFQE
jgi:hypothetical protein